MTDKTIFREALDVVLGAEGGFSNHKADRGGATNFGVTQRTYDYARARAGLPPKPVRAITREEAEQVYFEDYWQPARCADMSRKIAIAHFDSAVNHGPTQAAVLLQRTAQVKTDGRIGPKTLAKLDAFASEDIVVKAYINTRLAFYRAIVRNDPTQLAFLCGWENRMEHLKDYLLGTPEDAA